MRVSSKPQAISRRTATGAKASRGATRSVRHGGGYRRTGLFLLRVCTRRSDSARNKTLSADKCAERRGGGVGRNERGGQYRRGSEISCGECESVERQRCDCDRRFLDGARAGTEGRVPDDDVASFQRVEQSDAARRDHRRRMSVVEGRSGQILEAGRTRSVLFVAQRGFGIWIAARDRTANGKAGAARRVPDRRWFAAIYGAGPVVGSEVQSTGGVRGGAQSKLFGAARIP